MVVTWIKWVAQVDAISGNARITPAINWERLDLIANMIAKKIAVKKRSVKIWVWIKLSKMGARISIERMIISKIRNGKKTVKSKT